MRIALLAVSQLVAKPLGKLYEDGEALQLKKRQT